MPLPAMTILERRGAFLTVTEATSSALPIGLHLRELAVPKHPEADLKALALLADPALQGILLKGVETPAEIERVSTLSRVAEAERGLKNPLAIIAVLDTPHAVLHLAAFDRRIPRLAAYLFDEEALALACGAACDSALLHDLRLRLPLAASASGVMAIRTAAQNDEASRAEAYRDGYRGLLLHAAREVSERLGGVDDAQLDTPGALPDIG